MWTLQEALKLARELEPLVSAAGWHVALGGGVLHRGWSDDDLDLVMLPHSTAAANLSALNGVLEALGWVRTHTADQMHAHWESKGSTDRKHVEVWRIAGRRVDVIYPCEV